MTPPDGPAQTPAGRHEGLVAVISGGAGGIGRTMAERLAAEGARVGVLDVAPVDLEGVVAARCDVGDRAAVRAGRVELEREIGRVNAIVHCAARQDRRPFDEVTEAEWSATMTVNVTGAFHLLQEFLPSMRSAGWGRVVLVTSSSFFSPPRHMAHYIASKGALHGLVRGLAAELGADGVTVNALAPGLTRTEHAEATLPPELFATVLANQAVPRSGTPADQAAALSFLLSRDADFMTGQTLLVDGGEGHV